MSFGISELRTLYDTLMEIGRENNNNKTFEQIKKEFFNDLKIYDKYLGQEMKETDYKMK